LAIPQKFSIPIPFLVLCYKEVFPTFADEGVLFMGSPGSSPPDQEVDYVVARGLAFPISLSPFKAKKHLILREVLTAAISWKGHPGLLEREIT